MRALPASILLVVLSGCAGELPPTLAVAPYCELARPIYWSAKDTRTTKEQADRENAKWKRLCAAGAKRSGP
jgi:hypothetical protein